MSHPSKSIQSVQRIDRSATAIRRILKREERGWGDMWVLRFKCLPDRLFFQDAIRSGKRPELHSRDHRRTAGFPVHGVAIFVSQDLIATAREDADGDLVGHGPARHEQTRLFSGPFSRDLFEPVHRRVLAIDVVPKGRFDHRLDHRRRGAGDGITP